MIDKIDFCITHFMRRKGLKRLLTSIWKYYPDANVHVADSGKHVVISNDPQLHWHKMPYDCGLSAMRNYLVKQSERPYFLLLEDDFIFTEETKIEIFYKILKTLKHVGVIGGMVKENGYELHFEHRLSLDKFKKELRFLPDDDKWFNVGEHKYKNTESVLNFALFKREVFDNIKWDYRLKLGEHTDFFLRLKGCSEVVYTPKVKIDTIKGGNSGINSPEYKQKKARNRDFLKIAMKKHHLTKMIYLNGFAWIYDEKRDIISRERTK